MTVIGEPIPTAAQRPPLQEITVEPVQDPQALAIRLGGSIRLFVDVRLGPSNPVGYPDGLPVALASLRNGLNHEQIGERWLALRNSLPADQIGHAAREFYDSHYDISCSRGIQVPRAERGEPLGVYADRMAGTVLRTRMPEDTAIDLRALHEVDSPGTRFYHAFPADSALVFQGWLARGRLGESLRTLENDTFQTLRLGYPPNYHSRIAMLRTQTPLDSHSVDALAAPEFYGPDALRHFRDAQIRNLKFWNDGRTILSEMPAGQPYAYRRVVRRPDGRYGYRNWDDSYVNYKELAGLRPESAEEDWRTGEKLLASMGNASEEERGAAWEKMVRSLLAACESFQDMADYQLGDGINLETSRTVDIMPSWLQASMAHKYKIVAESFEAEGNLTEAAKYWGRFNELADLLNNGHWRDIDETHGHYTDTLLDGTQLTTLNAAQIMVLLVGGIVPYDRSIKTINTWRDFLLGDNGLNTSPSTDCPEQWSGKRNWPSLATWAMWAAMQAAVDARKAGLDPTPFLVFADDVRLASRKGMQSWYDARHTIPERINDGDPTRAAVAGEYCVDESTVQHGFGMSIGALRVWEEVNPLEVELDPRRGSAIRQVFIQTAGNLAVARFV